LVTACSVSRIAEPPPELDRTARNIVDAALRVHRALGPGLPESAYQRCLAYDLKSRGLNVEQQRSAPIRYWDILIEAGFHMDMLVNQSVIVEIKSTERLSPLHEAQLRTSLKITGYELGLLINFNSVLLKDGLRPVVNSAPLASWRLGG
jgi:GxxExxY protein